jgi:hypothetical protein
MIAFSIFKASIKLKYQPQSRITGLCEQFDEMPEPYNRLFSGVFL